MSYTFFS